MIAPPPPNERERLESLRGHSILDTPPELAFDRITRLVAKLLKVPISTVTLVDESRQWFKSVYGLESRESSRDVSFCAHAILDDKMFVIPDASGDARFMDNPLVTGDPRIRFYAGMPLKSEEGLNLGTLCAIDTRPRQLSEDEMTILRDLAGIVSDELNLRLAMRVRSQQGTAISHLKSGVLETDPNLPDNPIIFGNPGFWAMTGYGPEEVLGRNCRFLQGPGTDPAARDAIRAAISTSRVFQGEVLNYRKDGTPFWNELTISPVYDQNGALINFVGLQSDVTERKRISDELQQSFQRLQELEKLRDNLTHMIIHDLRSPLTSVLGGIDLLAMTAADKLSAKQKQYIELARSGVANLQELITSLLVINRLEAGEMPLHRRDADLRDVILEATNHFLPIAGTRSILREMPAHAIQAHCDTDLVKRIVANLVSNALKFTPDKGTITVALSLENGVPRVSVTDSGIGIPAGYLSKIFEKFGQVDSRGNRHSTGLGLTFCKLAVETHGGQIAVKSEMGKGTTFWFTLPAQPLE